MKQESVFTRAAITMTHSNISNAVYMVTSAIADAMEGGRLPTGPYESDTFVDLCNIAYEAWLKNDVSLDTVIDCMADDYNEFGVTIEQMLANPKKVVREQGFAC